MAKKYQNINDPNDGDDIRPKKRTLNPFENMFRKDGKGVEKDEVKVIDKPNLVNFFRLLRRRLNHVFSCNILSIFGNFPLIFLLIAFAYTTGQAMAPDSQIFPLLSGSAYFDNSPVITMLLGIFGAQDTVTVFSAASYVFFGLALLILFTFGPVQAGIAYIYRNIMRGEPVFIMSDFWYAVKKNLKQSIILGIIDLLMMVMLVYDIVSYRVNLQNSLIYLFMYVISYGMSIFYFFVRMYMYLMTVTFDMSIFKIIKNSIFFAILGIKRNIMALAGTVLAVILTLFLISKILPLGIIIPFMILFGLIEFIGVYAAFPKIKEIMIDPYYTEVEASQAE